MQAFRGDGKLKQDTIRRVSGHVQAGQLLPGTRMWDGGVGKGSAGGCAVHNADLAAYERELGVPEALVALMEATYTQLRAALWTPEGKVPAWASQADAGAAQAFPVEWLEAIAPGADLTPVARQFTVWLLSDSEHGALAHAREGRVRKLLQAIAESHRGDPPAGTGEQVNWANLRERAMALRDEWPEATCSIDAWAASVAETACWPLTPQSGRVAEETLEVYTGYASCKAATLLGWTAEDEERTHALHMEVQKAHDDAVPSAARRDMKKEELIAALQKASAPYEERMKAEMERRAPYEREFARQRWLLASSCREALLRLIAAAGAR